MATTLTVIAIWAVISVPFGMAVGKFICVGMTKPLPERNN